MPSSRVPIGCKWLFQIKISTNGYIGSYKARLVAKGFSHKLGFDFQETFSPMIKSVTVHIVLSLALTHKWCLRQFDSNSAFLHGELTAEVYMVQRPGFEQLSESSHMVCTHLCLYVLKGLVWSYLMHGLRN